MTTDRRADLTTRPNGSLWSESVYRAYIGEVERREQPVRVRRLSETDKEIAAFGATSRGSRAA